ncbi:MAG: hypothetical protein NT083_08345 [Rhodocyclales bacterium]|nr:hypothetical protein [Rhodocyclales bacterium]
MKIHASHAIRIGRSILLACLALLFATPAYPDARNLAPGFTTLPKSARVLIMPPDVELLSISGGGIAEPRADWTAAAHTHLHGALSSKAAELGLQTQELREQDADDLAEISALHAAVARSIAFHHLGMGSFALPTKGGKLDWSLGDAVKPVLDKSAADYALFIWLRDSYASSERKAAIIAMALFGVGVVGGMQIGYASLVDLRTGRIMWFNRLARGSGDLREAESAGETVGALLDQFPGSK